MGFNCGIIGLPNVGKSTLFNALTENNNAAAENYPFCTIEPNIGRVAINDKRIEELAIINNPKQTTPTYIEFVDIAGLVKGASKGEGLGNQFLGNIREVDAICHVLRCFEDTDITHVNDTIDPINDAEIIDTELMLADIESLIKRTPGLEKKSKTGDKDSTEKLGIIKTIIDSLEKGIPAREINFNSDEKIVLSSLNLLSSKPILYIANVDENSIVSGNKFSNELIKLAINKNIKTITLSAKLESEISEISDIKERKEFLKMLNLKESGLDKLAFAGYNLLNLITFFTAGPKEVKAWTIKNGTNAQEAARKIHEDFYRGFIAAETISFHEYINSGSEQKAKEAGLIRTEGKEYIVLDGDIMLFRFNV